MLEEHFYGNWYFVENLGEGSFGNVKLAQDKETNDVVAVKIVDISKIQDIKDIEREICILKLINHNRIIRYYGHRKESLFYYIFFEYLTGGELFNWIDPGYPMENSLCFRFSSQILEAINYLHVIGVAHRDLKLENVLLDENNNVKIIDFGLSTIFRYKGKERFLAKMCGSMPYTAPEILLSKEYRAQPADIWSFGVILFALFTGELPWDAATDDSAEYRRFQVGQQPSESWGRLDKHKLELITNLFCVSPIQRYTYKDVCESSWYRISLHQMEPNSTAGAGTQSSGDTNGSRLASYTPSSGATPACLSQMNPTTESMSVFANHSRIRRSSGTNSSAVDAFSQPIKVDDLVVSQMTQATQTCHSTQRTILNNVARKMTRFYVKNASIEFLKQTTVEILESYVLQWTMLNESCFSVNAVDRRRNPLNFKIELRLLSSPSTNDAQHPQSIILVNIKRNKGDGIEFKKFYRHIKTDLNRLVNCVDVI